MREFEVGQNGVGQRADKFVAAQYPQFTRSALEALFDQKLVLVNDKVAKASQKVKDGDKIAVDESLLKLEPPKIDLPVIYEDKDVIVIDKPAGVLTHSKGALNLEGTVASFIKDRVLARVPREDAKQGDEEQRTKPYKKYGAGAADSSTKISASSIGRVGGSAGKQADAAWWSGNRAGIVHRLDRATSGVIITAKNAESLVKLQKQFSKRKAKKQYIAVVEGNLEPSEAIVDAPIGRNPTRPQTFRATSSGKPAVTEYHVIKSLKKGSKSYSLVDLRPQTGRTHQLRVHMAYIGHPIVGDYVYGHEAREGLLLHARSLKITLPSSERRIFEAELPDNIRGFADV